MTPGWKEARVPGDVQRTETTSPFKIGALFCVMALLAALLHLKVQLKNVSIVSDTSDTSANGPHDPSEHITNALLREIRRGFSVPRSCNSSEWFHAVRHGYRSGVDQPFYVPMCRVTTFSPEDACDILSRNGPLIIVGDSLMRHLTQAIITILADDYERATTALADEFDQGFVICEGDLAYDDGHVPGVNAEDGEGYMLPKKRYCREHSVANNIAAARRVLGFCPKWNEEKLHYSPEGIFPSPLPVRAMVLYSGGLHYEVLDHATTYGVYATPLPVTYTRICATLHAPGEGKPAQYLSSHGLEATKTYNDLIFKHTCQRREDIHFDAFKPTELARSIDGQHYHQDTNVLLAQLLLNLIEAHSWEL